VNHGYKQQMTPVDVLAHARWPLSVFDNHRHRSLHQSRLTFFFFHELNLVDTGHNFIANFIIGIKMVDALLAFVYLALIYLYFN